jgi:hypothetical protein
LETTIPSVGIKVQDISSPLEPDVAIDAEEEELLRTKQILQECLFGCHSDDEYIIGENLINIKAKHGLSDLNINAAMDSIVPDDGARSTLCLLISNQDEDKTNGIASYGPDSAFCAHKEDSMVHNSTFSTFCTQKTDNMVHHSTFSTLYAPLTSQEYAEYHERAWIYVNYGKELTLPAFNPDAVTHIDHEGTFCNSTPSPTPKQDSTVYTVSTPSAKLSPFSTPAQLAQLAQLQSITIHAPMSRIQNNKYGGTLSELFLAINHHFSYSIPCTEHLDYNPDSFVCVCHLCNGLKF